MGGDDLHIKDSTDGRLHPPATLHDKKTFSLVRGVPRFSGDRPTSEAVEAVTAYPIEHTSPIKSRWFEGFGFDLVPPPREPGEKRGFGGPVSESGVSPV